MTYPGLHHPSRRTDAARTLRHTRRTFASCREQEATLTPDMVDLATRRRVYEHLRAETWTKLSAMRQMLHKLFD